MMIAYRKHLTISNKNQVVLSDLPFPVGQRVEVLVIAEDEQVDARLAELRQLLHDTQALPQAHVIDEAEIAEEIAAYRAGQ